MTTHDHAPKSETRRPDGRYEYPPENATYAVVERKHPDGTPYIDSGWAAVGEIQKGEAVFAVLYKPPGSEQGEGHPGFEKAVPMDKHLALQAAEVERARAEAVARTLRHLAGLAASDFAQKASALGELPPFTEDDIDHTLSAEEADLLRRRLAAAQDTRPINEGVVNSLNHLRGIVGNIVDRVTPRTMGLQIQGTLEGMVRRREIPADDERLVKLRGLALKLQSDNSLYRDDSVIRQIRDILEEMQ